MFKIFSYCFICKNALKCFSSKVLFPGMKHLHAYSPPGFERLDILKQVTTRVTRHLLLKSRFFGDGLRSNNLSRRGISIYMVTKIGEHVKYHKENLTIKILVDCMVDRYLGIFLFLLRNTLIYCYICLQ